ncbi:hypothetical protein JQ614_44720 [Bradyrhizobium diazoefficiens]|uniref:hypothetical protein n=1 Tax=Bradyrhizobium diazoefficiens TaxID=1355477 RepID=UPI000765C268|nr:hypothetical protein [Bradyrhizobium diazoefficiens]MBR0868489.1 hypothetical protein [Bradyrhizobium diazoefficiens]MBR0893005.1 hypothetical protein [Bradyrhizobium diazoefficiens]MBR0924743.1 hypothetical protein [Bradyrhizobium diazoefficiens]
MSDGSPVESGTAEYAIYSPGSGAAADVDRVVRASSGGPDDQPDEYDGILAKLDRTCDEDCRVATHESGHIVAARLLGHPLGGATVDPGAGYEGRVWGEEHMEAFAEGRGDAADVRQAITPMMPQPGEDINSVSDVFANVYSYCIELAAGRAAEQMLLGDADSRSAIDDQRQARELALLICKSKEAVESFIAHCDIAARDLLAPYGDVVMTLSIVLRIKRTLDGAEIDEIIRDVETRKALAMEQRRRAEWRKGEFMATRFREQCEPLDRRS